MNSNNLPKVSFRDRSWLFLIAPEHLLNVMLSNQRDCTRVYADLIFLPKDRAHFAFSDCIDAELPDFQVSSTTPILAFQRN
jgi:hypothetical protein